MKQRRRRMRQEICSCSLTKGNSPASTRERSRFTREPSAKCYYEQLQLCRDTLHVTIPYPYTQPHSLLVMQLGYPTNQPERSTGLLCAWAPWLQTRQPELLPEILFAEQTELGNSATPAVLKSSAQFI